MRRSPEVIAEEIDGSRGLAIAAVAIGLLAAYAPGMSQAGPDAAAREESRVDAATTLTDGAPPPIGHVLYAPGQRHSPLPPAIVARLQAIGGTGGAVEITAATHGRTLDVLVADLWAAVDQLLLAGTIPVLSTLPPMHTDPAGAARIPVLNAAVRAIAQGRQVPLVDLDGVDANDGLARNRLRVEALARVHAALGGIASDAGAPLRAGQGTPSAPYRMPLPISDLGDVRAAAAADACGSTAKGVVYELDLGAPATVQIDVIGSASTIEIVAGGACIAQGTRALSVAVPAGASKIVIRGTGEYVVIVR